MAEQDDLNPGTEIMQLTAQDSLKMAEAVCNPREPNDHLAAAAQRYLKTVEDEKLEATATLSAETDQKLSVAQFSAAVDGKRRCFLTAELSDEEVELIAASRMDLRHDHLNMLLEEK